MCAKKKSSRENAAIIKGSITYLFFGIINIKIRAVDGVEQRVLTANKVEVRSGLHRLIVDYNLISHTVTVSTNVDLLFNTEVGHKYKIKGKESFLVVMDTTSGVLVAKQPFGQYNISSLYST